MPRFELMKTKRGHLRVLTDFPNPEVSPMPKVDKWRLCWDYNKDAKAIIQSTLTNVVPFCEQMGPRVWVGKQAEYPSPSWLEKTRINGKQGHCQDTPIFHVIIIWVLISVKYINFAVLTENWTVKQQLIPEMGITTKLHPNPDMILYIVLDFQHCHLLIWHKCWLSLFHYSEELSFWTIQSVCPHYGCLSSYISFC